MFDYPRMNETDAERAKNNGRPANCFAQTTEKPAKPRKPPVKKRSRDAVDELLEEINNG